MTALRQSMIDDMRVRNLSPQTQALYVGHVSLFARHFGKSPSSSGRGDPLLSDLFHDGTGLATSSVIVAVAALRFSTRSPSRKTGGSSTSSRCPKKPQTLLKPVSSRRLLLFLCARR